MVASLPMKLIIGTVFGILAGLGVGGGSLLILWLTFVLGVDHSAVRTINLLFFLPSAVIACFLRWKDGTIPFRSIFPVIVSGCMAAGICSWISAVADMTLMKKLFGVLLLFTGLRELFYKRKQ